jgi:two-component system invasion response regulator UvrY
VDKPSEIQDVLGVDDMVRILVADESPLLRAGIKLALAQDPEFQVVAEAESAAGLSGYLATQPIDVVVLGITLKDIPSLQMLLDIRQAKPNLPVLVINIHNTDFEAIRLIRAGANAYLAETSSPEELARAVHQIARGRRHVSESIAGMLAQAIASSGYRGLDRPPREALSDRELQVVCSIASGKRVSQIAAAMNLSVKTISTYRTRALEKLYMRTNAELTRYALEHDLVD